MNVRQVLRILKDDGWFLAYWRGSHRQLRHATKPGKVTLAGRLSMDLHPKVVRSILRQAGLEGGP